MINRDSLIAAFLAVRKRTEALAEPLSAEDQLLQAMPDASPVKWHRAHTTWFFDTFVLGASRQRTGWGTLFNSYYEAVGPRHARSERGLLSRPSVTEVTGWRSEVDAAVTALLEGCDDQAFADLVPLVRLGMAHEQQHQELMLSDLLAAFSRNPIAPVYRALEPVQDKVATKAAWLTHPGGHATIGAGDQVSFAFDNEGPRHGVWLEPFELAATLTTVGQWRAFAEDGGYETPSLWLSDGISFVREQCIDAPAYTRREGSAVVAFGLHGERELHPDEPIMHLSFYEADALATWLGGRLPTEAEWEAVAAAFDDERLEPASFVPARRSPDLFGVAWQWTRGSYDPYPGYAPTAGALGEYNGKFMCNQRVLRGSSIFTPPGHSRPSYRNFWYPQTRFQATGLRLARSV